jgi:hypothetical protein
MSFASKIEYKLRESSSYSIQFILHGYDTMNRMSAFCVCPAAMNESGKIKNLTLGRALGLAANTSGTLLHYN